MDKLYNAYWSLPDDNRFGIIGKAVNRVAAKIVKRHLDRTIQCGEECGINRTEHRDRRIICSLTSFPARIENVWQSLETVFRQTVKADEIVLWLSKDQFGECRLPDTINKCIDRGLTLRWVEGDLRSHKKYFYALQEYSNADIVLLDDDLYYPEDMIEILVGLRARHPEAICAVRVHKMRYLDGNLMPYRSWIHNYNRRGDYTDPDLFFTSGPGTLIPAGIMPEEIFNQQAFMQTCPRADDVWLNMLARRAGIPIWSNNRMNKDELTVKGSQVVSLVKTNVGSNENDTQIEAVLEYLNSVR